MLAQLTNLYLKPGEEIRTPLMALLFWRGNDLVRSQNLWRHWYIDHVIPLDNGQPQGPVQQIQVSGNDPARVHFFVTNGILPDICWRDAGAGGTTWYPSDQGPNSGSLAWLNTGAWDPAPIKYPHGFRPFSDYVHSQGMQASSEETSVIRTGCRSSTVGKFNYVTYDSVTSYVAGIGQATPSQPAGAWHIVNQSITEMGANDLLSFSANSAEDASVALTPILPVSNSGLIADRNDGMNEDPVGLVEPFAIGGHAQDCCGEGETFAGNIAEIIIYARALSSAEVDQVYEYLTAKYLSPPIGLLGDYNEDNQVDAADYVTWRANFGQFFALANENPLAETEGFVDEEDFDFWRSRFGATTNSSSSHAPVPEPSAALLAAMLATGCARRSTPIKKAEGN